MWTGSVESCLKKNNNGLAVNYSLLHYSTLYTYFHSVHYRIPVAFYSITNPCVQYPQKVQFPVSVSTLTCSIFAEQMLLNVCVGNGWYTMVLSIHLSRRYMCVPFSCLHGLIWLQKQEVVKTTDASALQHVPPLHEIQFTHTNFCKSLCLTFKNTHALSIAKD